LSASRLPSFGAAKAILPWTCRSTPGRVISKALRDGGE
jgi:hypothetical protein